MPEESIMITSMSDIYDSFLSKISDYGYLKVPMRELEEEFFGYFKSARAKFYRCKKSLNTELDETGELVLKSTLSSFELEVIIALMLAEYLMPITLSSEAMKQLLSDKDFKIHSQANQLRELRLLQRSLEVKAKKMITEYSYLDLGEEKM